MMVTLTILGSIFLEKDSDWSPKTKHVFLFSLSGEFAQKLAHPSSNVTKE